MLLIADLGRETPLAGSLQLLRISALLPSRSSWNVVEHVPLLVRHACLALCLLQQRADASPASNKQLLHLLSSSYCCNHAQAMLLLVCSTAWVLDAVMLLVAGRSTDNAVNTSTHMVISTRGSTLMLSALSRAFSTSSLTVVYRHLPGLSNPAMFLFSAKNSAGLFCCSLSLPPFAAFDIVIN
eukprot:GHRQ01038092.1.p1 GENE.GHRQ01038092.1~~GHRQ01038092.1.p1  ORF type:complete len:183 (-),score=24.93 GHRQ01038092.1:259-807(-)